MPGPVLVTGATGFAGSHLLDLLRAEGADLVAWRHHAAPQTSDPGICWQEVNVLDRQAVRRRLAALRPSVIYHLAGAAHVGQAWTNVEPTFAANVRGTHHLIEGLRDEQIETRVLIPSSAMVYAPSNEPLTEDQPLLPPSPYGLSKLVQELAATDAGSADVLVARAFNHIGPRQDGSYAAAGFARAIAGIESGRLSPELRVGNLDARRDLTDVRDCVRAYRTMVERGVPGRPYNVCSGRAVRIGDLLELLLSRSSARVRVTVDPARYRPIDQPIVVGDPTRIATELGWTPSISLERTADDLLEYWRRQ